MLSPRKLKIGVAGLGRAFTIMLPTFTADARVALVAAADPRGEARARFADDFSARTYGTVEDLCGDPAVEVVYVATPHQDHARHVAMAAAAGKHVLVEKPMAVSLEECFAMIEAARAAKVHLVVGHSHSFDAPVKRAREIVRSGAVGDVRMITALNFTDFLYRPRRPEELDTSQGGGVVFSQGAHQLDVVRLLAGGQARSVRAATGCWDERRPTEGAYQALLAFDSGAFASLTYSGYGRFDSDEFTGWISEMGLPKERGNYGLARKKLREATTAEAEAALKNARNYGGADYVAPAAVDASSRYHQHFGLVLVSCDRADLRLLPNGIAIYDDAESRLDAVAMPDVPRAEVIDELYDAVVLGRTPLHDGSWALATTEACLAILRSAREGKEIPLVHQVAAP
jgi:phthalate 4,5-cis-dihydrodiol dehydrogenase